MGISSRVTVGWLGCPSGWVGHKWVLETTSDTCLGSQKFTPFINIFRGAIKPENEKTQIYKAKLIRGEFFRKKLTSMCNYVVYGPFGTQHIIDVFSRCKRQLIYLDHHSSWVELELLPSRKLTAGSWKMMVGRLLSFWDGINFQGRTVKLPGGIKQPFEKEHHLPNLHFGGSMFIFGGVYIALQGRTLIILTEASMTWYLQRSRASKGNDHLNQSSIFRF